MADATANTVTPINVFCISIEPRTMNPPEAETRDAEPRTTNQEL
jgi:hypothetical protein